MYEKLKGDIARVKQLNKWTYADIGKMTGYRPNTIAMFMSGVRESGAVAQALEKIVKETSNEPV